MLRLDQLVEGQTRAGYAKRPRPLYVGVTIMPDISMCYNNTECPVEKTCYRSPSVTKPSPLQSYIAFYKEGGKCDNYWPIIAQVGVDDQS